MLQLYLYQDSLSSLWNKTSNNFLCYVLGRVVEQLFELHAGEAMDHFVLAADSCRILVFKLI